MNCAQAAFSALTADSGIDRNQALRIASCFGGGMRCGEVCGAVTGALMAIGLCRGYDSPDDPDAKARSNALALEFERRFIGKNGSILCRELLGYNLSVPEDLEILKSKGLFTTVCPKMVADAVVLAESLLEESV
jgi:C_GCAxxG_C_C family probable redox protein